MREICTSGSTRGEWAALIASPSLLLYRPRGAGFRFTRQLQLSRNAAGGKPVCSMAWRAIVGAELALSPSLRQFSVSFGDDLLLAPFPLGP